jgi:hypothetical protein
MKTVGIYLLEPIFTHNQLYVALSWATHVNDVSMFCPSGKTTTNVVCLYEIVAMIFLLYLLLAFLFRWVRIPTCKSRVKIPCIGCKNGCNRSYVHDVRVLKTECFRNSYGPIEQKLSQLKIVNWKVLKVLSTLSIDHFACKMGLHTRLL